MLISLANWFQLVPVAIAQSTDVDRMQHMWQQFIEVCHHEGIEDESRLVLNIVILE